MKRILTAVLVSTLFTGCAQLQDQVIRQVSTAAELAVSDCLKMGFKSGTPQYQQCVLVTSQNIRNNRASVPTTQWAPSPVSPTIQVNSGPTSVTCVRRIGNRVECN